MRLTSALPVFRAGLRHGTPPIARRAARGPMAVLAGLGALALLAGGGPARAVDRALVIGVNHYPGITIQGVPGQKDLQGAVFDAKTFNDLLKNQFGLAAEDIHTLFDADASRQRILDEFRTWLIEGTNAGDRVFFYFAGHGAAVAVQDEATSASRMTSAIVPADAHGDLVQQPVGIQGMILGVEMKELLAKLPGRSVTVVADSCQSGSISRDALHPLVIPPNFRARTLTPAGAVNMTEKAFADDTALRLDAKLNGRILEIAPAATADSSQGSLVVWTAATTDQVTFDLNDRPGGIFTQSFADGLRDKKAVLDGSGKVTAASLLNFVRDQAKVFCGGAGPACSAGLTPQLLAPSDYLAAALTKDPPPDPVKPPPPPPPPPPVGEALATSLNAILSHRNDFTLEVAILPGPTLKLGQQLKLRVKSGESGKVAVFDLTTDGDLTQIFPNAKTDRIGKVNANAPLTMPDAYWGITLRATPPAGAGAMLVLVTEPGVDITEATGVSMTFKPLAQTSRLLQVIGTAVEKPVVSSTLAEPTRSARWAFVRVPYTVTP